MQSKTSPGKGGMDLTWNAVSATVALASTLLLLIFVALFLFISGG